LEKNKYYENWMIKTDQANTLHHVVVEEEEDVVQGQRAHQVQEEPRPDQPITVLLFSHVIGHGRMTQKALWSADSLPSDHV